MSALFQFERLTVWQKSMTLVTKVYKLIELFPDSERFALSKQLSRAIVSVPSNISEGTSRFSSRDQSRFFEIAFGSLVESFNQLLIAARLGYISSESVENLRADFQEIAKMLSGLRHRHNCSEPT